MTGREEHTRRTSSDWEGEYNRRTNRDWERGVHQENKYLLGGGSTPGEQIGTGRGEYTRRTNRDWERGAHQENK